MINNNSLRFELPEDGMRVHAKRDDMQPGPTWSVEFVSTTNTLYQSPLFSLLKLDLAQQPSGDSITTINGNPPRSEIAKPDRLGRLVRAAVFLGATLAEPSRRSTVGYPSKAGPRKELVVILNDIGYRPDEHDTQRPEIGSFFTVHADANGIKRVLGPEFPLGFSLSPTEIDG